MMILVMLLALLIPNHSDGSLDKYALEHSTPAKQKQYKFVVGTSKCYLDGVETTLDKIPEGAVITGLVVDGETILKIEFKGKK